MSVDSQDRSRDDTPNLHHKQACRVVVYSHNFPAEGDPSSYHSFFPDHGRILTSDMTASGIRLGLSRMQHQLDPGSCAVVTEGTPGHSTWRSAILYLGAYHITGHCSSTPQVRQKAHMLFLTASR